MHSPPVLEVRDLAKRYGAIMAVREIGFSISAGEILGVLGPNGAGKSTIVKMITGMVEPTHGAVLFHGERIDGGQLSAYKRRMGYVPEQPDLYGFLTGWEYLDLVATLRAGSIAGFSAKKPRRCSKASRSTRIATRPSPPTPRACGSASY